MDGDFAPLVDVSSIELAMLTDEDDPILKRATDRLLSSLDDPNGILSAFQSFAS